MEKLILAAEIFIFPKFDPLKGQSVVNPQARGSAEDLFRVHNSHYAPKIRLEHRKCALGIYPRALETVQEPYRTVREPWELSTRLANCPQALEIVHKPCETTHEPTELSTSLKELFTSFGKLFSNFGKLFSNFGKLSTSLGKLSISLTKLPTSLMGLSMSLMKLSMSP